MNFDVSFLNNIALKIVANNMKYLWQLTGFYPPTPFIFTVIIFFVYFLFCVSQLYLSFVTYRPTNLFFYYCCVLMLTVNLSSLKKISGAI